MVVQSCLENMLPNPDEFGRCFHELFKQPSDNQRFVVLLNFAVCLLRFVILGNESSGRS